MTTKPHAEPLIDRILNLIGQLDFQIYKGWLTRKTAVKENRSRNKKHDRRRNAEKHEDCAKRIKNAQTGLYS